MKNQPIKPFFAGKTVLLTGVTGFVGKGILEKILFSLPDVARVYTLIRAKGEGERSADIRLDREVAESPIFGRLRRRHGPAFDRFFREKVAAVAGDLGDEKLGWGDEEYARLAEEVDIVINSAAAVSFDERLDVALTLNTLSPGWVARFAEAARADALVHVSTCYVSGTQKGDIPELLPELIPPGGIRLDRKQRKVQKTLRKIAARRGAGGPDRAGAIRRGFSVGGITDRADQHIETIREACRQVEERSRSPELTARFRAETEREGADRGGPGDIPLEERIEERRRIWLRDAMVDEGMRIARTAGWNDTYTFTKALGEIQAARAAGASPTAGPSNVRWMMLLKDKGVPTAIVRPAIIESSYLEPEPGWIEGFRMADPVLVGYGKGTLRDFPGNPGTVMDLIPLDHVVNTILAAAVYTEGRSDVRVYQSATGDSNPVTLGELYGYVREYFDENPMHDAQGRIVRPRPWHFPSVGAFRRYYRFRYQIPLAIARALLNVLPFGRRARNASDRIQAVLSRIEQIFYYVKIYAPYTRHAARYETGKVRALYEQLSEEDRSEFPFDAASIDWKEYVKEIHIPGIKRRVLRMVPPDPLPVADPLRGLPSTAGEDPEKIRTVPDLLYRSVYRHHDKTALRIRREGRPVRYTYSEVLSLSRTVGSELVRAGVRPGDRVILWAENQPEWGIAYFGIVGAAATAIPLDYQMSLAQVWSIVEFTGARAIVTTEERAKKLRRSQPEGDNAQPVSLLNLHGWGAPFGAQPDVPASESPPDAVDIDPDSLASILFTSGTTVAPKGVCLTHRNLISNVLAVTQVLQPLESDEFLSILPMHHALEFTGGFLTPLFGGSTITSMEGLNAATILDTMQETGTTVVITVPRLLEVFLHRIREQVPEFLRFVWEDKPAGLRGRLAPFVRRILAGRVMNRFGGRIRLFVVGGAALDPEVWEGFERLGFAVCEGYGLTETSPVITVNPIDGRRPGTVGPPLPDVEVRIEKPDERGIGEILVRGENVMRGYLGDPGRNRRVFQDDWFRTGDHGTLDGDGYLRISGRVDDLIVTPAGKNVHPDEVEALYKDLPGVKEMCVLGVEARKGRGKEIHAVLVPDDNLASGEEDAGEKVEAAVAERSKSVASHHRIQRVHVWHEELPKTATFKVKRSAVLEELREGLEKERKPGPAAPADERERNVIAAVASAAGISADMIDLTDRLQTDLAVDSLARVDLAADLEHRFGRKIPDDRVEAWETVGDILSDIGKTS